MIDRGHAAKARAPTGRPALQRPLPKAPREHPAPLRLSARRQACRPVRPPLREHAPPAFKRRRAKHTRAKREKRPAEPMALRAISIRHSNFFVRFRISIQLYEALLRYSFKCAIKGAGGILPCLHRGTFSYFTAPSFNLYIGPPSYFVSFRKSDLYIPVPPFARLPSRARLSMFDFGPLRTPSV